MATTANSFAEWLLERPETPGFMKTPVAAKDLGCIGMIADVHMESLLRAVQSGWCAHPNCPADALDLIGRSRQIPRYDVDTDETYAARVFRAWQTWSNSGSRTQLIEEIEAWGMGSGSVFIVSNNDWGVAEDPTDAPNILPGWTSPAQDDQAALYARFWIYVKHTGHSFTGPRQFNDGVEFDAGALFDIGGMTPQQAADLHGLIERHRAAHELAMSVTFLLDAGSSGFTAPGVFSGQSVTLDLANF